MVSDRRGTTLFLTRSLMVFLYPSWLANELRPSLYDERVIGLGYAPMFLTHSNEALEIEKFKRARENKIEFAYDYGNLNENFEKIDSPFQQTSSLKPYVPTVILEKIIINLEDEVVSLLEKEKGNLEVIESLISKGFESSENAISESENQSENDCQIVEKDIDILSSVRRPKHSGVIWKKKGSSNTSIVDLSYVSNSKLNKDVKRYSRKDLLSCNNSHHVNTRSAYACNDAINVSCNSRLYASYDVNDLFVFDDASIRNSRVSKTTFRKKPRDSLNARSKNNLNNFLPRTLFRWFSKMQPLAEPIAKWIPKVVQIFLWILDSGCSKHMTGNRALLTNFVEKFLGTVHFANDDFAVISSYGDVIIGSMTIKKVYYVEGLGHNLFSVGQFCDNGFEVAFRKSTCFVRTEYSVDLLTGDRSSNLYTIPLNEITSNSSACLLAKASSQSWLWHQHEASEVIISLIKKTQVNLQLQVQCVRTDNGTKFKNKTLAKFFDENFPTMYERLLQECDVYIDVMCSYLQSSSDLDEITELQCLYLHKVRECDCLAKNLSEQTEFVRVAHKTNVSRPQPRSNQMKGKVVPNTSHVKFKKTEVEEHPRISSISNQTKSVTACNDSLNSRTSNVNAVCATCGKCVFNSNHDACVSKFLKDVNARTKKPNVVPISTRKPKSQANKSVATPHKKTVASESTITNSKSYYRMLYKKTNKAWKWWIAQQCPSAYTWVPKTKRKWVPKVRNESVTKKIVQLILFIVDSGCTKHMTGNLSLLCNFVEKYLGTVRFGNDQFAPILGYGDLVQGNITIKRVYYVEGLNHNLFSVGQFCDADLEVAFRKSTCFVRDLQGNDLLTGNRGTDLYTISLQETTSSTPICLMAKASPTQAWLWHRRLSHLNFDYINLLSKKDVVIGLPKLKYVKDQLCSSCEVSKAKRSSFKSKTVPSSKGRLNLLHMDLCGPMRVASINGKKYILVIVDDYSRYTWTLFLRSKDETPEVLKDFLTMIQRNLQAPVISVRTDRGTEFLNKTLHAFFKEEGIEHQTSTPRTPEQNGVVERRNRTLVEAARTMLLIFLLKLPLYFGLSKKTSMLYSKQIYHHPDTGENGISHHQ
ncbi:retrovirus-related pol polyprotein from transposon TNT 1-94 [Tanacetum coccineum]